VKPKKASRSFLKKRTKKLLFYKFLSLRCRARRAAPQKVFASFFKKKFFVCVDQ